MTDEESSKSGAALVTAVVLTWNTADFAIQTLESLAGGYAAGLRVVMVDNGSVDDSVEVIQAFLESWEHSAAVTFIRSPENLGFPGGVNLGTEAALAAEPPPDYIWTINPDAVVNPHTVTEMVAVSIESGAEIVGVGTPGDPHVSANAWPRIFYLPHNWCATEAAPDARWWPAGRYGGSCALFRADLIRRLIARDGSFQDASLFLDWDEWDVTRRAASLGATVVLAGRAYEEHDSTFRTFGPSPMAKARQYYQARNAVSVARRFMPWWQFWLLLPVHVARDFSWFARRRIRGEQPNERAYILGTLDALRGTTGRWKHHPESPKEIEAGVIGRPSNWRHGEPDPTGDHARVTAVVVCWNTPDLAIKTMESLEGDFVDGLRIVLVDNGSVEDSVQTIQAFLDGWEHSSAVTFLRSAENLGFTGGVNLGTGAALADDPAPDYIWLLNPDAVVHPSALRELLSVAAESGAEMVSASRGERDSRRAAIWPMTFWWPPMRARKERPGERWWRADRYQGWCTIFAAGLVRELIERDGHFQDESLFMYGDERETTLRARGLGAVVVFSRDADVEHSGGDTKGSSNVASARQYYLSRNSIVVARRYLPWWQFWWMLPLHLARDVAWLTRLRLQGQDPREGAYLRGVADALRGRMGRWKHHPATPIQTVIGPAATPAWASGPEPPDEGTATVTAVVLTWNTAELAIRTLQSLAGGYANGLRVVLVDNGSIDDSVAVIQGFLDGWEYASCVTLLRSDENLGFPGGVNLGVAEALEADPPPNYIWTLNPDAIVSPAIAEEMVAVARESGAPIVSASGSNETYVAENTWPQVVWARPQTVDRPMLRHVRWWRAGRYHGASSLFDSRLVRELLRRDGYFLDPGLFLDWDEWDTTRRAAALGVFVVQARDAEFSHPNHARYLGKSPMAAARQYYMSRNEIIVSRRYMPGWKFSLALPVHLVRDLSWFVRLRVRREQPNEKAYILGVFDGLRGKTGKWKHHPPAPHANA